MSCRAPSSSVEPSRAGRTYPNTFSPKVSVELRGSQDLAALLQCSWRNLGIIWSPRGSPGLSTDVRSPVRFSGVRLPRKRA
eukprot:6577781-Alexandrium_andersonii.AAC.1